MDLMQLNLQCLSYYTVKANQPIKIGDKILLVSFCITYASIISEGIELVTLIFPQHREGFGKYLVVWTILRKMISKQLKS